MVSDFPSVLPFPSPHLQSFLFNLLRTPPPAADVREENSRFFKEEISRPFLPSLPSSPHLSLSQFPPPSSPLMVSPLSLTSPFSQVMILMFFAPTLFFFFSSCLFSQPRSQITADKADSFFHCCVFTVRERRRKRIRNPIVPPLPSYFPPPAAKQKSP